MEKHYCEELVYAECSDGVILTGLVIRPADKPVKPMALLWIPGYSINFYHPSLIPIGRELAGLGYTCLIVNTRGHDLGANLWRWREDRASMTRTWGGAIWELFDESKLDIAAWIDFASGLGLKRLVLLGHSYGARKVAYYQTQMQDPRVYGLVLASSGFEPRAPEPPLAAQAEGLVAQGRGLELLPWGSFSFLSGVMSAQTYLTPPPDLYGARSSPAEIANLRCPLLLCCGSREGDDESESQEVIRDHEMIRERATGARSVELVLFEGANHGYDHHEREVAAALAGWMDRLV